MLGIELMNEVSLYSVISKPLAFERHWKVLILPVALVLVTSIGVVVPATVDFRIIDKNCVLLVHQNYDRMISFMKMSAPFLYSPMIPSVIISVVYFFTARALKSNTMKHDNSRAMQLRNEQNAKIVRMFVVIVVVFFILTLPYAICVIYMHYLGHYYEPSPTDDVISSLLEILHFPYSANRSMNPIVYAKLHSEVNGYLKRIVQRVRGVSCQCCDRNDDSRSNPWAIGAGNNNDLREARM